MQQTSKHKARRIRKQFVSAAGTKESHVNPVEAEVPTISKTGGEMALSEYEGKDIVRKRKKTNVRELKLTVSRRLRPRSKPLGNVDALKESKSRLEDQMMKIRSEYREEHQTWKQQHDRASTDKFFAFREKVLEYRKKKRDLVLNNVKHHEERMFQLKNEYDRVRLEKRVDRINKESIESAMRVDALKRLKDESHTYITADNLDQHIAEQLDPERLILPTVFYNRLGVNDEVRLEIHKSVVRQLQYDQAKKANNKDKALKYEYESMLVMDDMYPHERLVDPTIDFSDIQSSTAMEVFNRRQEMMEDVTMSDNVSEVMRQLDEDDDESGYEEH